MFRPNDITPLEFDVTKDGVTQSLLTSWMRCETLARLKLKGWHKPSASEAIIFGNYFHEYLDVLLNMYKNNDFTDPDDLNDKQFMFRINNLISRRFAQDFEKADPEQKILMTNLQSLVSAVIPVYFEYWREDFFGTNVKNWTQIEQEFSIDYHGVKWRGKRDGAYKNVHGEEWLFETKTKSSGNEDVLQSIIPHDFQVLSYMLSHRIETKRNFKGVLYNVVRKPQLRKSTSENYASFIKRCLVDIRKRPQWYFNRYEVVIPEIKIVNFETIFIKKLYMFQQWLKSMEELDLKSTHQCTNVYGTCEMLDACMNNQYHNLTMKTKHHSELGE